MLWVILRLFSALTHCNCPADGTDLTDTHTHTPLLLLFRIDYVWMELECLQDWGQRARRDLAKHHCGSEKKKQKKDEWKKLKKGDWQQTKRTSVREGVGVEKEGGKATEGWKRNDLMGWGMESRANKVGVKSIRAMKKRKESERGWKSRGRETKEGRMSPMAATHHSRLNDAVFFPSPSLVSSPWEKVGGGSSARTQSNGVE